ncbi:GNAT family N-acetyltransferase [Pseudoalteromonas sp. MMG005]|uniref:GNAT family N-acetyltransferase n=1 Tax=Pseudoalteromonas sp. MMG005 TaxID=2822682 RepID=UPI001B3A1092|nr:GNAT family N-acetyltransferase [Pseudoalteromonas sp. MMG005]MBQ4845349.1 GNAT family N-acetyltransferase [Pseudoalteromonas sp. MMG005]
MNITVRRAKLDELEWVNKQYERIGFRPSQFNGEVIAIALLDGKKVALGRLQRIDSSNAELGGMYVNEHFRGRKLAESIVCFLLKHTKQYEHIYCLPFSHLADFYQRFGFHLTTNQQIPKAIIEKHQWCNKTYEHETYLFELHLPT